MPAPTVANFTSALAGGTGATSVIVAKPTGIEVGELLLLLVGNEDATNSATFPTRAGWTKLYEYGTSTAATKIAAYYRTADGTEAATETITWATGADAGGAWYLNLKHTTGAPFIAAVGAQVGSATSLALSAATAPIAGCLLISHVSYDGGDCTGFTITDSASQWSGKTVNSLFDTMTPTAWSGAWATTNLAVDSAYVAGATWHVSPADGIAAVTIGVRPGLTSIEIPKFPHTANVKTPSYKIAMTTTADTHSSTQNFPQATDNRPNDNKIAPTLSVSRSLPVGVPWELPPIITDAALSVGYNLVAGVSESGVMSASGYASNSQQTALDGLTSIKSASVGYDFSLYLPIAGNLTIVGSQTYVTQAQLDTIDPSTIVDYAGVYGSGFICLLDDGTIVGFDSNITAKAWTGIQAIGRSQTFFSVLFNDGTLDWVKPFTLAGNSPQGSISTDILTWTDVELFAIGYTVAMAKKTDGTFYLSSVPSLTIPTAWESADVIDIATTANCAFILKSSGTVDYIGTGYYDVSSCLDWRDIVQIETSTAFDYIVGMDKWGRLFKAGNTQFSAPIIDAWKLKSIANPQPTAPWQDQSLMVKTRPSAMYAEGVMIYINRDGTVGSCGSPTNGEFTNIGSWADMFQVDLGFRHSVGLDKWGDVFTSGTDTSGSVTTAATWTGIKEIRAGYQNTFGIKANGDGIAVGYDGYGQVTAANTWTDLIDIAGGQYFAVGLKSDGTCYWAGLNAYSSQSMIGAWTDVVSINMKLNSIVAVRSDGTCYHAGYDQYSKRSTVLALTDVKRIFVGTTGLFLAVFNDGTAQGSSSAAAYNDLAASWTGVEWGAIGTNYFYTGFDPINSARFVASTSYPCITANVDEKAPLGLGTPKTQYVLGPTVARTYVVGSGVAEVAGTVFQTFSRTQSTPTPFYVLVVTDVEVPTYSQTANAHAGQDSGFGATVSHTATKSPAIAPYYLSAPTFSRAHVLGNAINFKTRSWFDGSLKTGTFEDASESSISPKSIDIQYSKGGMYGYIAVSLPAVEGLAFLASCTLPLSFKVDGVAVVEIDSYETVLSEGRTTSLVLTSRDFATARFPTTVITQIPKSVVSFTKAFSITLFDAYDIIPGDIVEAGNLPPFVVTSANHHVDHENTRSILYG